ncbi:MAG TPA: bacillithiol biosynthesis BshC, partial [Bacteroidia bacterium]|nr:bacillithiol biosynthesis BshC [Bacteroidia bacterium]
MSSFSKSTIPFSATNQFQKLFLDYVSGSEKLSPFYSFAPDNKGYAEAIKNLKYNESFRSILVEVIRDQYKSTGISINENLISKLNQQGTMT